MEKIQVDLLQIERSIRLIRCDKVILDEDLAEIYGVETKKLVQAVKRNLDRFPADFMFQSTNQEFSDLRFQAGTSSQWGMLSQNRASDYCRFVYRLNCSKKSDS